jgi:hypothetical protein
MEGDSFYDEILYVADEGDGGGVDDDVAAEIEEALKQTHEVGVATVNTDKQEPTSRHCHHTARQSIGVLGSDYQRAPFAHFCAAT